MAKLSLFYSAFLEVILKLPWNFRITFKAQNSLERATGVCGIFRGPREKASNIGTTSEYYLCQLALTAVVAL